MNQIKQTNWSTSAYAAVPRSCSISSFSGNLGEEAVVTNALSGFGCCLFSQAMMLLLLIYCLLLLPLFCAVFCPSVYIQAPQWLRLLSVLTGDDAVVVDLVFIVAPIVCAVLCPSVYIQDSQWFRLLSHRR